MIAKASVNFIRITPRKVRYVIDLIRKKSVNEAHAILNGSPRRAGDIVRKLLNQAVDAASKNSQVAAQDLIISKILADGGPSMRRFRAASMGRASLIKKRTSHITLELDLARPGQVSKPNVSKKPTTASKIKELPESKKKTVKTSQRHMAGAK